MNENTTTAKPRRFFRFQLRTLFFMVAIVAILTAGGIQYYQWYHSVPLSQAIETLNAKLASTTEVTEKPVTEDEVIRAIESQLSTLEDASGEVKSILRRIVSSRRIPEKTTLDHYPLGDAPADGFGRIWCLRLTLYTSPNSKYGLLVRETDHRTTPVKKVRKK